MATTTRVRFPLVVGNGLWLYVGVDAQAPIPPPNLPKNVKQTKQKQKNLYNFLIPVHLNCMFDLFDGAVRLGCDILSGNEQPQINLITRGEIESRR